MVKVPCTKQVISQLAVSHSARTLWFCAKE